MKTEARPKHPRMSAEERRDDILQAAVTEFALKGLHGTSTETIAARAGVSQPYLFRLFGTKKDLFLAAVERGFDRVLEAFRAAAEGETDDVLAAMGEAYFGLISSQEELLLQLQAYAASSDPEVERVVRARYTELMAYVAERSGRSEEDVLDFFSHGMMINVATAIHLWEGDVSEWVHKCIHSA